MYQGPDGQWYDDSGIPIGYFPSGSPYDMGPAPPTATPAENVWTYPSGGTPYPIGGPPPYPGAQPIAGITGPNGEPVYPTHQSPTNTPPPPEAPAPAPTDWSGLSQSVFGAMPTVPTAPPFEYDPFQAPAPFAPPSAQDVLFADPGFGFRRDQGTQAMQQSAAARGVLNTGGTLQDLIDYGQKAASQEYGNAFNRALGTYDENYRNSLNSYITNFGNALTKYNTNYGTQYLTPYNQLWQQYGQGVNNQAQLFGQQFQTATA